MNDSPDGYQALSESEWAEVERIQDLADDDELEAARRALDALMLRRPHQPDLLIIDAGLKLEEGEPHQALAALRGAERAADPAQFFLLRAATLHDLSCFEEAEADALRSIAIAPDVAISHDLLSRVRDHLGNTLGAAEAAERAAELDPEEFHLPLDVSDADFDAMVEAAIAELPEKVRVQLEKVPVLVQALPETALLTSEDPPFSPDILGFFIGHHLLADTSMPPGAPGAIYIFRRNLTRACSDREELEHEVAVTLRHEVGHLLGLDEDELEDWGLA